MTSWRFKVCAAVVRKRGMTGSVLVQWGVHGPVHITAAHKRGLASSPVHRSVDRPVIVPAVHERGLTLPRLKVIATRDGRLTRLLVTPNGRLAGLLVVRARIGHGQTWRRPLGVSWWPRCLVTASTITMASLLIMRAALRCLWRLAVKIRKRRLTGGAVIQVGRLTRLRLSVSVGVAGLYPCPGVALLGDVGEWVRGEGGLAGCGGGEKAGPGAAGLDGRAELVLAAVLSVGPRLTHLLLQRTHNALQFLDRLVA